MSPEPPYTATVGYGHRGRVRFGAQLAGTSLFTPPALSGPRAASVPVPNGGGVRWLGRHRASAELELSLAAARVGDEHVRQLFLVVISCRCQRLYGNGSYQGDHQHAAYSYGNREDACG